MRHPLRLRCLPLALFTVLAACGPGSAPADASPDAVQPADAAPDATAMDATPPPPDGASPSDAAMGADTTAPADADRGDVVVVTDGGPATLRGAVRRSARDTFMIGGDGRGDLYIAVFTENPATNPGTARAVGQQRIPAADLSTTTARVTYEIAGIPPRAEPYHVSAFLDDNDNATPAMAGPDRGDSLAIQDLGMMAVPRVTITAPGETTLDLDLNFILPF